MNVRQIKIMVASPSDTHEERAAVAQAMEMWNAAEGDARGIVLTPLKWETHATPGCGGRPQGMINEALVRKADALLAIFRAKVGSPTGEEISGTIEEIKFCLSLNKPAAAYFYDGPIRVGDIDLDQFAKLKQFKAEAGKIGIYGTYGSVEELKTKVLAWIGPTVNSILSKSQSPTATKKPRSKRSSPTSTAASPPKGKKSAAPNELKVNSSEDWMLLGAHFLRTNRISEPDGKTIVVEIHSESAEEDAFVNSLSPERRQHSQFTGIAFGNDAFVVRCSSVTSVLERGQRIWTVTLTKENPTFGTEMGFQEGGRFFTADAIAELRARRILLAESPTPASTGSHEYRQTRDNFLEMLVQGLSTPVVASECPLQAIVRSSHAKADPNRTLQWMRLIAIMFLKGSGVIEHVRQLELGPFGDSSVHVRFRGTRAKKYSNVDAHVIEVEGDCPLPSS